MATVLSISDVFSLINPKEHGKKSVLTLPTGQKIPLSNNLMWLYRLGDLTCCECGCNATHLQQHFEYSSALKQDREVWRVMTWSNSAQTVSFLNIDHIIPVSRGGITEKKNLRVTCYHCNFRRGNQAIIDEPIRFEDKILDYLKTTYSGTKNFNGRLSHIRTGLKRTNGYDVEYAKKQTDALLKKVKWSIPSSVFETLVA